MKGRLVAIAGATAAATLLLVAAAFGVLVRRPLPAREGTFGLRGLSAEVLVSFDAAGIPHVEAETSLDAWCALGWLHASDRFFQMELRRRAGAGRLSEIFGPAGLDLDRDARRGGHMRRAAADAAALPPEERAILDAYAAGVNAWLAARPRPLELVVLGIEPEPWRVQDSLAFGWRLYADLTDSEIREVQVLEAVRAHGAEVVADVLRASGEKVGSVPPELASLPAPRGTASPPPEPRLPRAASNAWAVSGARSASGAPLLASDPHLPVEVPGVWYAAHLRSRDGLHVAGLTLAGAPGIMIGHNGRVAWGITMNQADDTDLFLEELDAEGDATREPGGAFLPVTAREETIEVRGADAVREVVAETPRGTLYRVDGESLAWSRAWAADSAVHALSAFLAFDRSGSGAELREAARLYGGPPVNVVWADVDGHIGVFAAGSIPERASGTGRFPAAAWTGDAGWRGTIPFDELPRIEDPPEGFVASANDDWSESGHPLPYPGHYAGRDRIRRIRDVLGALDGATVDDFRALQNDLLSLYALRVVTGLRDLSTTDADASRAVRILSGWDGRVDSRGPAALLYRFLAETRRTVFEAREDRAGVALPAGFAALSAMIDGSAPAALWDDPGTEAIESREPVLLETLARTVRDLEREDGPDPSKWSWGRRHRLDYEHPLWSRVPVLSKLFDTAPIELPGDWSCPRVAGFDLRTVGAEVRHIASARVLIDLGDPDGSRLVLPMGQSAHVGDRHRLVHLPVWIDGRDFPLPFTKEAVARAASTSIRLVP